MVSELILNGCTEDAVSADSSSQAQAPKDEAAQSSTVTQAHAATPRPAMPPMPQVPQAHGVLVLNKPQGPTSARCLTAIKRLGQKKIGHAGTLDPMASGVLLVLLGHATKISGHLMADGGKIYQGQLRLGQVTDTWDAEGHMIAEAPWEDVTEDAVRREVLAWQGRSEQPVPAYSAAKHQGQPLYKLARSGKEAPEKVKEIEISHAEVLTVSLPYVSFRVHCSSGTYIRSLAHSLGTRLGCGAVLTELIREYSHPFGLEVAHTLDAITASPECLQEWVLPVTQALPHWPQVTLDAAEEAALRNGIAVRWRKGDAPHGAEGTECAMTAPSAESNHDATKAILLSREGEPLALAEKAELRGAIVWAVLRGLWS